MEFKGIQFVLDHGRQFVLRSALGLQASDPSPDPDPGVHQDHCQYLQ